MKESQLLMMIASAALGAAGLACLFLPAELLILASIAPAKASETFIQVTGALYLGFAMMNWAAKTVLIGGIYARPLALGNFFHFMVGAIATGELAFRHPTLVWIAIAALYAVLAAWFGRILFFKGPA